MVQNAAVAKLKDKVITRKDKALTIEEYIESKKNDIGQILPANMTIMTRAPVLIR